MNKNGDDFGMKVNRWLQLDGKPSFVIFLLAAYY